MRAAIACVGKGAALPDRPQRKQRIRAAARDNLSVRPGREPVVAQERPEAACPAEGDVTLGQDDRIHALRQLNPVVVRRDDDGQYSLYRRG